ncbi:amino acid dehydrogenase [Neobacillus piezotolerans]|uniref:Amino acid dehydrogenase n=1 Tax=Neobacillus piezotolerans TaxID=2259171 RepID=A0A3D8GK13_9BACI|nr:VWA domain-containing protein [Neobacillus piezotolerans]RDU34758.1 amino acid dehydrogenase [Neobacillus piezotolerans]
MSKHYGKLVVFMFCFALMAGCQQDKEAAKKPAKEEQAVKAEGKETPKQQPDERSSTFSSDAPELPANLEGALKYTAGKFSAKETKDLDDEVKAELSTVPKFPENADEEQYDTLIRYLYSLYKRDYVDPREALKAQQVGAAPASQDAPAEKGTYNVEVILDSSGSMANKMGLKTRMELAKEAIRKFAASLPKEANISLRVYGHKGTGAEKDKQLSCGSNELVYSPQSFNASGLDTALGKFKPAGWTPLAGAIKAAQDDLAAYKGKENKNIIYIVSDGIETCGGNPVAAAESLKASGIDPVVNIIGFDVNAKDAEQLHSIAKAAGGIYKNVQNQDQLQNEFQKSIQESLDWINWKNKESLNALTKSNNQMLDIYGLTNEWRAKIRQEQYLVQFSLVELDSQGKITNKQNYEIFERAKGFFNKEIELVDELEKTLIQSTKQDLDTTLKQIDSIYEQNVSQK